MEYYKAARWFSPYHTLLVLPKLGKNLIWFLVSFFEFTSSQEQRILWSYMSVALSSRIFRLEQCLGQRRHLLHM